jgi:hypothetical protein
MLCISGFVWCGKYLYIIEWNFFEDDGSLTMSFPIGNTYVINKCSLH